MVRKIFNGSTCPNCWTLQPHSQVVVLKRPRHSLWPSWWQAQPHSRCSSSTISRTRSSGTWSWWSWANQRWLLRSRDQLSTNHSSPGRAPSGSSSASSSPSSPWFWATETCDVRHHDSCYECSECGYRFSGIMPSNNRPVSLQIQASN